MEINPTLSSLGNWVTEFTNKILLFIQQKLNLNPNLFETKLLNLIILIGLIFIVIKFAEKTTKIILLLLIIILIISVFMSFVN